MPGDAHAEFKRRQRTLWATADYAAVARHFQGADDDLVARAGVGPGTRVLDVAAGTGNVAIAARRAGGTPHSTAHVSKCPGPGHGLPPP